jgi:hypothetical protein
MFRTASAGRSAFPLMHEQTDHGPSLGWISNMKTLIAALALATLIAAPTFTQSAIAANEVIVGGKVIGADPDANVRFQLGRDAGSENF